MSDNVEEWQKTEFFLAKIIINNCSSINNNNDVYLFLSLRNSVNENTWWCLVGRVKQCMLLLTINKKNDNNMNNNYYNYHYHHNTHDNSTQTFLVVVVTAKKTKWDYFIVATS